MCLIALAIGASARWPLVIAANRDEFLDRPTLPLARWTTPEGAEIISGRDLRAGGAWLGVTPAGRVAMLTNVREPSSQPARLSRGELTLRWLAGDADADQFLAQCDSRAYGPCNLVLGDFRSGEWTYASNRAGHLPGPDHAAASPASASRLDWHARRLEPGIYGLSNAALDTPWPKTRDLKAALRQALQSADEASLMASLWQALDNRQRAALGELPHTGVPTEFEHALSSAFVDHPQHHYGTRCSTLLRVDSSPSGHAADCTAMVYEKTPLRRSELAAPPTRPDSPLQTSCQLHWRRRELKV